MFELTWCTPILPAVGLGLRMKLGVKIRVMVMFTVRDYAKWGDYLKTFPPESLTLRLTLQYNTIQ